MKKNISLIRACMTQNMNMFVIKKERENKLSKICLPIFLAGLVLFYNWSLSNTLIQEFAKTNSEYMLLTLYVILTFILTLIEGVYKSSGLLFNCKDDNLLFSLPIRKSTVLFVRVFKFYVFELMYNSLFILPAMVVYGTKVYVNASFYLSSFVALLLLPIIPIILSCIIGGFISDISSKFKSKNIVQIIITTVMLIGVFLISFNMQNVMTNLAQNAQNINDAITKVYYPAGAYVKMATDFNVIDLLEFIFIHLALLGMLVITFGKIYFKINSKVKVIKKGTKNSNYIIKTNKPMKALIKKELKKFISVPVLVINSCFGLVLFLIACIALVLKSNGFVESLPAEGITMTTVQIEAYLPVILLGLIAFASFMSSITCSMISLEGKAFNIAKSLPIKPFAILLSKIYTAVIIMAPCILIGDLIVFFRFKFNILEIILILLASIVLPLISETIGLFANLRHPRMDAENDTQVVKQSVSSMVAVLLGMVLAIFTIAIMFLFISNNIETILILFSITGCYAVVESLLLMRLKNKGVKLFNKIQA